MLGEELERLDVEGELGRGVVGGVHLDDGEVLRVEAEPFLGAHFLTRVEDVALGQGGIRPRAGPDLDLSGHSGAETIGADAVGPPGIGRQVENCGSG